MLALARVFVRYVRFLTPDVVSAIVEDNTRRAKEWRALLAELGVDPDIYLWDGSPCAFPGIRRYVAHERAQYRKPGVRFPDCIGLDDNDYPKHLWAFVFTGKRFPKRGPREYHLAHLADHNMYENRGLEEFGLEGSESLPRPFGLFTSAANTVFAPAALIRPTDSSARLRALLLRRAYRLYSSVCRFAPPPLVKRSLGEGDWDPDDFDWAQPVGTTEHIGAFLAFRRRSIEERAKRRQAFRDEKIACALPH